MDSSIETIKLKDVLVQGNGIIRNEHGRLIGRLVDEVEFKSAHVKGLAVSPTQHDNLERDFATLLNSYSRENISNTPDYILAEYLFNCLTAYELCTTQKSIHRNLDL